MSEGRSAEFEKRYQALLRDEYKPHKPQRLRQFLLGDLAYHMRRAEQYHGIDSDLFMRAVSSAEKCCQLLDDQEELIELRARMKGEAA